MQCATIEYARDVAGLAGADSTEFDPQTPHRVIYKLRELLGVDEMGGTMRLGAWPCKIEKDSTRLPRLRFHRNQRTPPAPVRIQLRIREDADRRRISHHRPVARRQIRGNRRGARHPWFLGCQFHPEFKSKPLAPHPLFFAFVGAALAHQKAATAPRLEETPYPWPPSLHLPASIVPLGFSRVGRTACRARYNFEIGGTPDGKTR